SGPQFQRPIERGSGAQRLERLDRLVEQRSRLRSAALGDQPGGKLRASPREPVRVAEIGEARDGRAQVLLYPLAVATRRRELTDAVIELSAQMRAHRPGRRPLDLGPQALPR